MPHYFLSSSIHTSTSQKCTCTTQRSPRSCQIPYYPIGEHDFGLLVGPSVISCDEIGVFHCPRRVKFLIPGDI